MTIDDSETQTHQTTASLIKQAIKSQSNGDLAGAEKKCRSALDFDPANPDAIHLLGVLYYQSGKNDSAIQYISQAIRIAPSNPYYYNNLGSALKKSGQLNKAKNCFKKALHLKPNYPEAIYNLAGIYMKGKKYEKALNQYQQAIECNRYFPEALNNMAAAYNLMGRFDEALDCCKQAVKINPDYREPLNNMGNAYIGMGNPDAAIACYEKSMKIGGESTDTLCNLGNAFQERGDIENAICIYRKAIKRDSSYGKAYNNLGTACRARGNSKEADRLFRKAVELMPDDAEAYHNIGNLCYEKGELKKAKVWFEKALSIDPDNVRTIINIGIVAQDSGCSGEALSYFAKALDIQPENSKARCHMTHELYQRCEWAQLNQLNKIIDGCTERELANGAVLSEMPFLNLIRKPDPRMNLLIARSWSQRISRNTVPTKTNTRYAPKQLTDKITVGYLSNNYRNHPTSHLIIDIFGLHDRDRFEINTYSYGEDDGSQYRRTIASDSDRFVDLRCMSHEQAANQIRKDRLDILVDLVGYMRGHRLEISAHQPAPVQVRWLGLAGTTGADFFDYLITDPIVTPEREAPWYSEKFVYMPYTYQVNSRPLKEPDVTFNRSDIGLPEKGFVFCCFCSNYKIEPVMFRSWMQILKGVPDSVLWLLRSNAVVEENLKREAQQNGVEPGRLIFAEKISKEDHLRRISIADFALDTRVVNGAATTSDALYAGVPVLSLKGTHFASRMSASILNAIGLDELVCASKSAYEKKAIEVGRNPLVARELKERLRKNRNEMPLFDTRRFVKHLEMAYSKMWKLYQDGKEPRIIHVDSAA